MKEFIFHILGLFAILSLAFIVISLFPNKLIKAIFSILFGIFFCIESSSVIVNQAFVNYRYYTHFSLEFVFKSDGFGAIIALCVTMLIAVPCFLYFFLGEIKLTKNSIKCLIFVVSLLVLLLPDNGVFQNLKEIDDIVRVSNEKEGDPFLNINFTEKINLRASFGGKNVVVIILESFERAFLHDNNKELTHNLRNRKALWTFYNMSQNDGSGWSMASVFTMFTGLPAYFPGYGNKFFSGAQTVELVNLGDVLKKSGYKMYFLSCNAHWGGMSDMLETFGVNVLDQSFGGKYPKDVWGGASDRNIFAEAKSILGIRSKNPVALFIETVGTHCPKGRVDKSLLKFVPKKATSLEIAAASTDYLVEDFMRFLGRRNLLDKTAVYVVPDHLSPCKSKILARANETRSLWLMTNCDKQSLQIEPTNFYQIDLPRVILSGAKIQHNAAFLSDFIVKDKNTFILENRKAISQLNAASFVRKSFVSKSILFRIEGEKITCKINGVNYFSKALAKNDAILLKMDIDLEILSERRMSEESEDYEYYDNCMIISVEEGVLELEWIKFRKYSVKGTPGINLLRSEIIDIWEQINMPMERVSVKYNHTFCERLPENLLKAMDDLSKIIIISGCSDVSLVFRRFESLLKKRGLRGTAIFKKPGASYLLVFSGVKVYFESAAYVCLRKTLNVADTLVYLSSCVKRRRCISSILIEGNDYSQNKRGLNIVVFDKQSKKVVEVFNMKGSR